MQVFAAEVGVEERAEASLTVASELAKPAIGLSHFVERMQTLANIRVSTDSGIFLPLIS
jgi:hypothetical protein